MVHTEETVAARLTEPADGAALVVKNGGTEWRVIWRDDAEADRWWAGDARGQHWFDDEDSDPMALYQHVKYAEAVYPLGEPVAVFDGEH